MPSRVGCIVDLNNTDLQKCLEKQIGEKPYLIRLGIICAA